MQLKHSTTIILVIILGLLLSSCGAGQAFGPAITPSPTVTNTPQFTPTWTPTPEPTATMTPLPTATIPFGKMSNPAMEVIDISITVEGDLVTAIFYLKDVPTEMNFHREGVPEDQMEYSWSVYFDTDNNMYTGGFPMGPMYGNDYALGAGYLAFSRNPNIGSLPIEKAVMASVSVIDKDGSNAIIGI
ncbi:MAG: hypothetical protein NTZ74_09735 [Chloroflexi bacterium]|nr:hypothetical protein [Chloroflexota bacterium]